MCTAKLNDAGLCTAKLNDAGLFNVWIEKMKRSKVEEAESSSRYNEASNNLIPGKASTAHYVHISKNGIRERQCLFPRQSLTLILSAQSSHRLFGAELCFFTFRLILLVVRFGSVQF